MKKIGFLSFGHWTPSPQSGTRAAADALLQSIDLAVAAEELGARVLLRQVRTGDGAPHHDPLRLAAALRDAFDGFLGEVGQAETWLP